MFINHTHFKLSITPRNECHCAVYALPDTPGFEENQPEG